MFPISLTPIIKVGIIQVKPKACQMVKIKLFQNMVMLHIKLKGITNAAKW